MSLFRSLSSCTCCSSLTTSENPDFCLKKPIFCRNKQLKPAVINLSFGDLGSVLTSRPVLFFLQCLCPKPLTYWKCSWQKLSLTSAGARIFIGTAGAKRASAINKSPHPLMPCYLYQEVCFNLLSGQLEKGQQENTASSFSAMLVGSWKPGLSYTWHVLHLGQPEATCRGWVTG